MKIQCCGATFELNGKVVVENGVIVPEELK